MYTKRLPLLLITNIEKRKKESLKMTLLKLQIGNMMKRRIRLYVQIIADYISYIIPIEKIGMDLGEALEYMNVKIVQIAHYVHFVQKLQRGKTENYFIMRNGNLKKNILEKSFQTKKLAKFTEN